MEQPDKRAAFMSLLKLKADGFAVTIAGFSGFGVGATRYVYMSRKTFDELYNEGSRIKAAIRIQSRMPFGSFKVAVETDHFSVDLEEDE